MKTNKMPLGIAALVLNLMPAVLTGGMGVLKISVGYPIQHIVAAVNLLCLLAALLISVTLVRKKETRTIPVILSTILSGLYVLGGVLFAAALVLRALQAQ